jgi:hypothetical protein
MDNVIFFKSLNKIEKLIRDSIPDFDNVISKTENYNLWDNSVTLESEEKCLNDINTFDESFYDGTRVKDKYLAMKPANSDTLSNNDLYNKTLDDLKSLIQTGVPPKGKDIILGTTEYINEYVLYCVKFAETNKVRKDLPFLISALLSWTHTLNQQFIDCIVHLLNADSNYNNIIIYLNKDPTEWLNSQKGARITILEILRMIYVFKQINLNHKYSVLTDDSNPKYHLFTIYKNIDVPKTNYANKKRTLSPKSNYANKKRTPLNKKKYAGNKKRTHRLKKHAFR